MWFVYICNRGGKLYTGITTELRHWMQQPKADLLYPKTHPRKPAAT